MTPEIITRVDAWLASNRDWVSASRDRQQLYCEWRLRSKSWGQLAVGGRAGVEAAMSGLLLALVREAWGERDMDLSILSDGGALLTVQPNDDDFEAEQNSMAESLGDALVSALEAAPC